MWSKRSRPHSGGFRDKPASLSHFSSNGLSLHMFLKLRFKASKREMVVWLKSFPYSFPMARPTSPWWEGHRERNMKQGSTSITMNLTCSTASIMIRTIQCNYRSNNHWTCVDQSVYSVLHTCVKPSLIRLCLKVLANCSSSSRSLGSSIVGVSNRLGGVWLWGRDWIGVAAVVRVGVAGCWEKQKVKVKKSLKKENIEECIKQTCKSWPCVSTERKTIFQSLKYEFA